MMKIAIWKWQFDDDFQIDVLINPLIFLNKNDRKDLSVLRS